MDFKSLIETAQPIVVQFGLKVVGAIVVWIVGRWLISLAGTVMTRGLERQKIERTIIRYVVSTITVALNIVLVVALLGYFGVETTSFAALLAAVGIAIGSAWSGLLSNFAAGAFILVLQPFKVGDYVNAGGVEGTVKEIGLFTVVICTPDNVWTAVGNAKIMGNNILNYSTNPYRRVELSAQLNHAVDVEDAIRRLKAALPGVANVVASPAPDVEILSFNERGPVLAVRPYVHTDNYWQVYFDTNKLIRATFGAAGYPVAESHHAIRKMN